MKTTRNSYPLVLAVLLLITGMAAAADEIGEDGKVYHPPPAVKFVQGNLERALEPALSSSDRIPVLIYLKDQPLHKISNEVQAHYLPRVRENNLAVRGILAKYQGKRQFSSMQEMREQALGEARAVTAEDKAQIRELNRSADTLLDEMRREIGIRMRAAVAADQVKLSANIASVGGIVNYQYGIENAIAACLPGSALLALSRNPLVSYIAADRVSEALMNVSAPSVFAASFWNAGFDGGIWDAAICDTGVDTGHPALDDDTLGSRTWYSQVFHATAKNAADYNDNSTSTDDLQSHGTHVAGTVFSSDATYRGIAWGADIGMNLKTGYRATDGRGLFYSSDTRAALDWARQQIEEPEAVNYSVGGDTTDEDNVDCQFWDAFSESKFVTACIAAGNSGSAAMTVTSPGITYNAITVANINDLNTTNRADDVISSSSGRGPTRGTAGDGSNGRRKPDIAAPGTSIYSANTSWETGSDFVTKSGTSMATPHVTGATLLLYDAGVTDPREVKAILINTADDWGDPGWDSAYGWGYLNLDRAYLHRNDSFVHSVNPRGGAGDYKLYKTTGMDAGESATMVWYRHALYNGSNNPTTVYNLSDLNLRLYDETNNSLIASELDNLNNVHQVTSNRSGTQVIRAYAWSTSFAHGATETYALATQEGTTLATDPTVTPSAGAYTPPLYAKFQVSISVQNTGDVAAHNCSVTLTLPAGVTLAEGSLTQSLGTINAGSTAYAYYRLDTTSSGAKTVNIATSSSSYGLTFTGSGSFTVTPGAADLITPYSTLNLGSPTYQTGGTEKVANGGFESGTAGWATSGTVVLESSAPHSGSNNLKLGPGTGSAYQTITIGSSTRANLTFWYKSNTSFLTSAGCSIQDSSGTTLVYPFSTTLNQLTWKKVTLDVSRFKGQTIRVNFYSVHGVLFGDSTLYVDDVTLKENETIWVDSVNSMTLSSRDDNSGIDYTEYHFSSDPWTAYSSAFSAAGQNVGYNYFYYRSVDNGANTEPTTSTLIYMDNAAPKSVLKISNPRAVVGGTEKVVNGGFESNLTGWTASGTAVAVSSPVRTGIRSAKIGETGAGSIYQDVPISSGASRAFLSLWFKPVVAAGSSYIRIAVTDPVSGLSCYAAGLNYTSDWTEYCWDVSRFKGSSVRVEVGVYVTSGGPATVYVDDVTVRQDGSVYILPSASLQTFSAENCGVQTYEYKIDSGSYTEGQSFGIASTGLHTVRYRALDNLDHQESDVVTQVNVDNAGPTGSVSINGGAAYTTGTSVTLNISASDPAGVPLMRFKNSGGSYTAWEPYSSSRSWTLTVGSGTKTVVVQFQDPLGNLSSEYSDGIDYLVPGSVGTIGQAKLLNPYPAGVVLVGKIVTGVFANQNFLYIEESDRSSGIKVYNEQGVPSLLEGQEVAVEGVLRLSSENEPEIYLTQYTAGRFGSPLRPLGSSGLSAGGGAFGTSVPGISGAFGLHSVGLLWRAYGHVSWRSPDGLSMRIDDGSGLSGGGLLVDNRLYGSAPALGKYVSVTGDLGATLNGAQTIPILRVRKVSDVKIH